MRSEGSIHHIASPPGWNIHLDCWSCLDNNHVTADIKTQPIFFRWRANMDPLGPASIGDPPYVMSNRLAAKQFFF